MFPVFDNAIKGSAEYAPTSLGLRSIEYLESSYENDNLPTVRLKPRHTDCPISQHEGEAQSEALRHMHLY